MPESQGLDLLPGVLRSIVGTKREEIAALRQHMGSLRTALDAAPPVRGFRSALAATAGVALIAECKRRSPGAGPIRPDLDPASLAETYRGGGATALSVLTDGPWFGGSLEDLEAVRRRVPLPILRKDFTLDPVQVVEARASGADAVLLIVRILSDDLLRALHAEAVGLGMDVLVEVHDQAELDRAVDLGATLIGINNRDLSTFSTDLDTTLRLLGGVPEDVTVVSESGIQSVEDVERLGAVGVHAILVGEALLKAPDPGAMARVLSGVARRERLEV